jgi:mono/diheme cytochrome c family protein
MFRYYRIFVSVLVLGLLTIVTTSTALAQDPANGKLLWEEQTGCQRCHGPEAQGLWAGPLAGSTKTAQEWIEQVRTPRRNMPSFSAEQISDQMVIDLHAYVSSLAPVSGFTPKDAGLPADAPQGQILIVEKRCVACHGPTGPIKGYIERGETPTAEAVIKQLRTPFKDMPAFNSSQVSDEEANLIANFLAQEVATQASPPPALPQSGGAPTVSWPFIWLLAGGVLTLTGVALRRLILRS